MGLWDPPSIASMIARLVSSPQVNYAVNSVKNAIPQASGPFVGNSPRSNPNIRSTKKIMKSRPMPGASIVQENPQGGGGVDPLMSMYQQLLDQLQSPVKMPTAVDTENLMRQVQSALNPIYDQRANSAEKRTGRATAEVKKMYRALSDDYERLAPQQIAQADAAQKEVEQLYGQLRSNIEGSYSRVSEEQGDLFKSLGIEAALPDVLDEQADSVQEAATAASQNQAQQEQRYMDIGQTDSTYYREGSPNATMTGNEISTDFLSQLQDYLGQVEAERSSGIQSAYMDQLGQAQTQLGQQQQTAQGEMARRQEMLWQMLQGQIKGGQEQQELNPDTFMSQLPQNMQQSVAGAFTRLQRSPEAVYGKTEDPRNPVPGTYVETQPQWYLQQADAMLERGEIDATTHQALQMYLQLYFKLGS